MNISLKNKNLELVKCRSSLQHQEQLNVVFKELRQKINDIGDISNLSNDIAFVAYVCNLVENISKPLLKGKEKSDLAIQLILETFPVLNNDRDLKTLQNSINFIVDNGIVNKIAGSKIVKKVVGNVITNFFSKNDKNKHKMYYKLYSK